MIELPEPSADFRLPKGYLWVQLTPPISGILTLFLSLSVYPFFVYFSAWRNILCLLHLCWSLLPAVWQTCALFVCARWQLDEVLFMNHKLIWLFAMPPPPVCRLPIPLTCFACKSPSWGAYWISCQHAFVWPIKRVNKKMKPKTKRINNTQQYTQHFNATNLRANCLRPNDPQNRTSRTEARTRSVCFSKTPLKIDLFLIISDVRQNNK